MNPTYDIWHVTRVTGAPTLVPHTQGYKRKTVAMAVAKRELKGNWVVTEHKIVATSPDVAGVEFAREGD